MKRITVSTFAAVSLIALSGCQSLNFDFSSKSRGDVFKAPSYLGKELPSGFFSRDHDHSEDSGLALRGFDIGRRHWSF